MIFFVFLQNHSFVFRFCFTDGGRNAAFFVERKEVAFFLSPVANTKLFCIFAAHTFNITFYSFSVAGSPKKSLRHFFLLFFPKSSDFLPNFTTKINLLYKIFCNLLIISKKKFY